MQVAGKLAGHAARKGLAFLQEAIEAGRREIRLDLREITSIDSLGLAIFDWIRRQNGNLMVDVISPLRGVSEEQLDFIIENTLTGNKPGQPHNTTYEEKRA
jgi:ABC-type transporter Mla MlaB component